MEFGLIGHPLGHSFSPEIHRRIGDYSYELLDLRPEDLGTFLKKRDFRGVNVTVPYKQRVIPLLDKLSPEAAGIGAVNTIVNRNGILTGYNTDYEGLKQLLIHNRIDPAEKKILILGTGGTSETARAVVRDLSASEIFRVSRNRIGPRIVSYGQAAAIHGDARILINTTPVGMYPEDDVSPVELSGFPQMEGIVDVVYHPLRTTLVLDGREKGIPSAGGLYMLAAQAVSAARLFLEKELEEDLCDRIMGSLLREKENIVLTGMPTSGKTTVGRLLAERTGRRFIDTDEWIREKTGIRPADWILGMGEDAFRNREREAIREIARETGVVLATGGGAVLDPDNVRALKRNGRVFFLDRSPTLLRYSDDRPLSSDAGRLSEMYRQRYGIYLATADIRIRADGTPEETAETVWKEFMK